MTSVASSSAWGLLRNAFQEFSGAKFVGCEVDQAGKTSSQVVPPQGTDSFGAATSAGAWFLPRMLPKRASNQISASLSGQHWVITGGCADFEVLHFATIDLHTEFSSSIAYGHSSQRDMGYELFKFHHLLVKEEISLDNAIQKMWRRLLLLHLCRSPDIYEADSVPDGA